MQAGYLTAQLTGAPDTRAASPPHASNRTAVLAHHIWVPSSSRQRSNSIHVNDLIPKRTPAMMHTVKQTPWKLKAILLDHYSYLHLTTYIIDYPPFARIKLPHIKNCREKQEESCIDSKELNMWDSFHLTDSLHTQPFSQHKYYSDLQPWVSILLQKFSGFGHCLLSKVLNQDILFTFTLLFF